MIYSISLLNKHFYFLKVHCATLYEVRASRCFGCTSRTAVRSIPCTGVSLAGGGRSAELSRQLARRQTLKTKSGKAFRALRLKETGAGHGQRLHCRGLAAARVQPRVSGAGLGFAVEPSHTRCRDGQRGWRHTKSSQATEILSLLSGTGADGAQLCRAQMKALGFVTLQTRCLPVIVFYFIYSAIQNRVHILLWGK